MFFVKKPSTLGSPWILSHHGDKQVVAISKDTTKDLKQHHIPGIDFLYQNYRKQLKGAILNEENGMNMQIQVAAFLNAMFNSVEQQFLVLVITPDDLVVNWHYHIKVHGGLKVQIVNPNTCPEDFDQENGLVLILSFSNLKLAEYLIDYDYFSVVISSFDEIASKLIIKRLTGQFNIGLTERSFYVNPNQKLQWTMINWSNPGCVGKLAEFYEADNDNFANFRDNYRHWWFRLTWDFCESFNKITYKENQEYISSLTKWALANHIISNVPSVKAAKKSRKRRKIEMREDTPENSGDEQKNKVVMKLESSKSTYNNNDSEDKDQEIIYDQNIKDEDESPTAAVEVKKEGSQDTIIYEAENEQVKDRDPNYVNLPSMDENPILNSIIRNFENSPEPVAHPYNFATTEHQLGEPNCSKSFENDDVLMSIIDSTGVGPSSPHLDDETQLFYKKEELRSQIFHDEPCTSKSFLQTTDDNGFFQSLIESDGSPRVKKKSSTKQRNDDVGDILKETEVLLRE